MFFVYLLIKIKFIGNEDIAISRRAEKNKKRKADRMIESQVHLPDLSNLFIV